MLDHADYAASTRQHELDHTDQRSYLPWKKLDYELGIICRLCVRGVKSFPFLKTPPVLHVLFFCLSVLRLYIGWHPQGVAGEEDAEVTEGRDSLSVPYGSYHQLYRIGGRLVAVGVVDVLPKCLVSLAADFSTTVRSRCSAVFFL